MNDVEVKWKKVLFLDSKQEPILKWIDLCNGSMFRLFSFYSESPIRGLVVGIERIGCFFFCINKNFKSWEYVSEKLSLPQSDARNIADWINTQIYDSSEKFLQQGCYSKEYIDNVKPYKLIKEILTMPLYPEIIE